MQIELLNIGNGNPHGFQLVPETTFEARWLEALIKKGKELPNTGTVKGLQQGMWFPVSLAADRDINNLNDYRVSVS